MIPAQLKRPWALVPCCILSLTLGLLLLGFLVPGAYPEIHGRIMTQHLVTRVAVIGAFCTALPRILLGWSCR
jgi:hypothetical protein